MSNFRKFSSVTFPSYQEADEYRKSIEPVKEDRRIRVRLRTSGRYDVVTYVRKNQGEAEKDV